MKLYSILILIAFFLITPIFSSFAIPKEDQLVYSSMKKISYTMQKKYDLTGGFCGCGKDNGFWKLSFSFRRYGSPNTLAEARALTIACSEDIIDFINQQEAIRFNLRDYPVSKKNVEIILVFFTKDGRDIFHPYIGSLSSSGGRLNYSTFDPNYEFKEFSAIEETYQEALSIVKQTKECDK